VPAMSATRRRSEHACRPVILAAATLIHGRGVVPHLGSVTRVVLCDPRATSMDQDDLADAVLDAADHFAPDLGEVAA
jgi:hypothetical protein